MDAVRTGALVAYEEKLVLVEANCARGITTFRKRVISECLIYLLRVIFDLNHFPGLNLDVHLLTLLLGPPAHHKSNSLLILHVD